MSLSDAALKTLMDSYVARTAYAVASANVHAASSFGLRRLTPQMKTMRRMTWANVHSDAIARSEMAVSWAACRGLGFTQ